MGPPRRRVSYVLPNPSDAPPRLQLPPHGVERRGVTTPNLIPAPIQDAPDELCPSHPRHRLGVASLALDTSTHLIGRNAPEGLLYSGGRDGLVMAWELELPMRRRRERAEETMKRRWELMTGWGDDVIDEEAEDEERPVSDGDILGDVKASGGRRRRRRGAQTGDTQWEVDVERLTPGRPSHFRQSAQMHSDWVNDLVLCNYNQTIVSASSDGTVKLWNPHTPQSQATEPSVLGTHADYVRCLASCPEQNWIASGSFDRTIKLWDLARTSAGSATTTGTDPLITLTPPDVAAHKSSVYALAADPCGHVVAAGSPERVVRMWDPRSGKRTGKLVGHTDNIRAILVSEDARYLLTGSADASIKLWSLSSQRCLHTFTHHTDSVWSLSSSHPSLELFYSGDRAGLVCRVDVEDCTDVAEGECVVLCQDGGAPEGVTKIATTDDSFIWTANGTSSIKRWRVPPRRTARASVYRADDADFARARSNTQSSGRSGSGAPRNSLSSSVASASRQSDQSLPSHGRDEDTSYGVPLDTLVRLTSPNDPFMPFGGAVRTRDADVATLYSAASVMSVPRAGPASMRSPAQALFQRDDSARVRYEERALVTDAVPLCSAPDDIVRGDCGLVRAIVLNDRMHALAVDTAGVVSVWDIVRGVCLGRYARDDVRVMLGEEAERSPREALETVRERIEGEAVVAQWCTVDTKTGVLTVHINDRWFDAEVYADEVGYAGDRRFNEETRINLGKWVLRNLFLGFIREEQRVRKKRDSEEPVSPGVQRGSAPSHIEFNGHHNNRPRRSSSTTSRRNERPVSSLVVSAPRMVPAVSPVIIASPRTSPLLTPMIPLGALAKDVAPEHLPSIPQSPMSADATPTGRTRSQTINSATTPSAPPSSSKDLDYFSVPSRQPSTSGADDDFSGWGGRDSVPPTPSTPSAGGLMGRLKAFGKSTNKRGGVDPGTPAPLVTPTESTPQAENSTPAEVNPPKTPLQILLAGPLNPPSSAEAPTLALPPSESILISEEASPGWNVIYRGTVSSTPYDTHALEHALPMPLLEFLLLNKVQSVPVTKISFVMLPVSEPGGEQLPELLNTQQSKLTASRFLRVRKLTVHVQDKLDRLGASSPVAGTPVSSSGIERVSSTSSLASAQSVRPKAENVYEILCNDVVLPLDMTLAAVRQYVWRSAAELTMHYRRKPGLQTFTAGGVAIPKR